MSTSGEEVDQQASTSTIGSNRRAMAFDSTLARSFAEQLDGAFTLDENLSSLSDTIANKHLTLQSQSRELEELQARIQAAEAALERAGSTAPASRSNGVRDVRDLWASQSATDPEDEAAYAEARAAAATVKAGVDSSSVSPPSRAAPPPPPPLGSRDTKAPDRAAPPPPPGRPVPRVPGARPIPRKMDYESEDDDEEDDEDEEEDDEEEEEEEGEEEEEAKVPRRK